MRRGTPLVDIDPRPFAATLLQAQGTLERDTQVLAQARDGSRALPRGVGAAARSPSSSSTTRRSWSLQTEGTVKNDRGTVAVRRGPARLLPHHGADRRPRRPAARRSRQRRHRGRRHGARGDHAAPADHGRVHDLRGQPRPGARAARTTARSLAGRRARPREGEAARERHAAHDRQPDRHDDRHGEAARAVRQRRRGAVPEPVRQHAAARAHDRAARPSCRRRPIQHDGDAGVRLRRSRTAAPTSSTSRPGVVEGDADRRSTASRPARSSRTAASRSCTTARTVRSPAARAAASAGDGRRSEAPP